MDTRKGGDPPPPPYNDTTSWMLTDPDDEWDGAGSSGRADGSSGPDDGDWVPVDKPLPTPPRTGAAGTAGRAPQPRVHQPTVPQPTAPQPTAPPQPSAPPYDTVVPPPSYLPPHMQTYEAWYTAGEPWARSAWLPTEHRRTLLRALTEQGLAVPEAAKRLYECVAAFLFTAEDCARVIQAICARRGPGEPLPAAVALAVEAGRIVARALPSLTMAQLLGVLAAMPSSDTEYLARVHLLQFLLKPLAAGLDLERQLQAAPPRPPPAAVALRPADVEAIVRAVHLRVAVAACRMLLATLPVAPLDVGTVERLLDAIPIDVVTTAQRQPSNSSSAHRPAHITLRLSLLQLVYGGSNGSREVCQAAGAPIPFDALPALLRRLPPAEVPDGVAAVLAVLQPAGTLSSLDAVVRLATQVSEPVPAAGVDGPGSAALLVFRMLYKAHLARPLNDLAALPSLLTRFANVTERLQVLHALLRLTAPLSIDDTVAVLERFPQASEQRTIAFHLTVETWAQPHDARDLQTALQLVVAKYRAQALEGVAHQLPPLTGAVLASVLDLVPTAFRHRLTALEALRHTVPALICDELASIVRGFDIGRSRLDALAAAAQLLTDADSESTRAALLALFPNPADKRAAMQTLQRAGVV